MPGKLNPHPSTPMNEGQHHWLRALHLPWPRLPPALDPLAGLRQPAPLSLRHWCPGHKTRPNANSKARASPQEGERRAQTQGTAAES
jgi:hypothetical protein